MLTFPLFWEGDLLEACSRDTGIRKEQRTVDCITEHATVFKATFREQGEAVGRRNDIEIIDTPRHSEATIRASPPDHRGADSRTGCLRTKHLNGAKVAFANRDKITNVVGEHARCTRIHKHDSGTGSRRGSRLGRWRRKGVHAVGSGRERNRARNNTRGKRTRQHECGAHACNQLRSKRQLKSELARRTNGSARNTERAGRKTTSRGRNQKAGSDDIRHCHGRQKVRQDRRLNPSRHGRRRHNCHIGHNVGRQNRRRARQR